MNFDCYMPVRVISGKNCVEENAEIFSEYGKKALIVTGGSSAKKSNAFYDVVKSLEKSNVTYEIYDKITQNPQTRNCFEAGKSAFEIGADLIIGIGGGSPLDAAKAVAIYGANPELNEFDIYKYEYTKSLNLILVGTTAGTGSEVTGVAVLTDSSSGRKKSVHSPLCYPKVSFCDYQYTETMPASFTVSTALDAFCHAVESYFSNSSNEISSLYAEKAIKLNWRYLKSFLDMNTMPDEKEREYLYEASVFGGLAINITGTCAPHTLGYLLTEKYHVPHGFACAVFEPYFVKFVKAYVPEKYENFFKMIDTDFDDFENIIYSLVNNKISMSEDDIEKEKYRWAGKISSFSKTPGLFNEKNAVDVYKELFVKQI